MQTLHRGVDLGHESPTGLARAVPGEALDDRLPGPSLRERFVAILEALMSARAGVGD